MRDFFAIAFERFGNKEILKPEFQDFVQGEQAVHDLFEWITFSERRGLIVFGKLLTKFDNRELGGITPEEAVEVGKRAKAFTKQQLANRTFTIHTYWEQVYDSGRYYGFVELPDGSDLATRLVEEGLGRVHTKGPGSKEKPVPTPKGKTFFQARDGLEELEREAREGKRGAWGY
jgi:hypothetical protein